MLLHMRADYKHHDSEEDHAMNAHHVVLSEAAHAKLFEKGVIKNLVSAFVSEPEESRLRLKGNDKRARKAIKAPETTDETTNPQLLIK